MRVKVEIRCGDRFAGEYIDLDKEREYFNESTASKKQTFEQYTRPVKATSKGLDKLSGNHFVFGYLEGLFQSDISPAFFLEENNDFDWVVTVGKAEE